ncbi:MAG: restriction endonuclease subunit S [Bacteroidetes bacterium]|jgi:type I restriction enzyme S subunit|nr:restriction endonuclease subunit S [Bacteroidota bacterium]
MSNKKIALKHLCIENEWGKYGIPASAEDYDISKTRYLRITDISEDGELLNADKKSVSAEDIEKYLLNEGDIVFARTGNSTGKTYYHEDKNGELAFAGFLIKYALDNAKINPKYLKFYTISTEYRTWVKNLSVGSTRGNINAQTFADCPITVPERKQQDLLVRTLSPLIDKIGLNNKISEELEVMAKTIYDYWFVQFDFPNSEGNPYKSSGGKMIWSEDLQREIPEGWFVQPLSKITEVSNESINPFDFAEKEFKHYSIPAFDELGTYNIEKGNQIKSSKFLIRNSDVLVSKLNPWFSRVIYSTNDEDLISSTEFVVWRTKNVALKNYLYMIARDKSFITYCSQSATGTSNSHKRVNPTVMMDYQIAFNEDVAERYGNLLGSTIMIYAKNQSENNNLIQLRNWLLPMLMNGQVTEK